MRIKRYLISLPAVLLVLTSYGRISAFAAEAPIKTMAEITAHNTSQNIAIVALGEQSEWHYRLVDGKAQKRLWSISYAKWLTEWEWC